MAEVEHFTPDEYDAIPRQYFDLFLFVDDGLIQQIPEHLKPAAWWAIDTHLEYERALILAQQADWTFAAQKRGALKLASDGIENASWLPLACDPEIHGKRKVDLRYDLAFVGNGFPGERERLLSLIQHRFPKTFVGNRYLDEMAEIYSASKIVFNRSLLDDLNMRVFEGLCSGALMITNSLPESSGQAELFQDQKHLVNYSNDDQLWEVMEYYLHHDAERLKIAEAGRQEILRAHTYRHRMESMLNAISNTTEMQKELAVPGNQMNESS
ncbi:MAG: family 2 glycosyl transferase, partial [Gimesia sp.]|nr:family 2 glycosyl transferase [Gimesia sp.]